jgi:hypothetical protein
MLRIWEVNNMIRLLLTLLCCGVMVSSIGCTSQNVVAGQKEKTTVEISTSYPYYTSIEHLSQRADLIIEGIIMGSSVEEIDISNKKRDTKSIKDIYTVYKIKVTQCYKGDVQPGEIVEIKQLGGETERIRYACEDNAKFSVNNKYIMFLETYENVPASLLNPIQSSYGVVSDALDKETIISISDKNDLTLTMSDLEIIKSKMKKVK